MDEIVLSQNLILSLSLGLNVVLAFGFMAAKLYLSLRHRFQPSRFSENDYQLLAAEKKAGEIIGRATKESRKIVGQAELEEAALVAKLRQESLKVTEAYQTEIKTIFAETRAEVVKKIQATEENYKSYLKTLQEKLGRAELEEGAIVSTLRLETQKIGEDYRTNLEDAFKAIKSGAEERIANLEKSYGAYIQSLEQKLINGLEKNEGHLKLRTDGFFNKANGVMEDFVRHLEDKTEKQLDQEIGSAKKIVDEYRRQRMEIIDENIVAILEKTLNITLGKKLTFAEQTEMVYEALEQAKKEGLFG